MQNHAVTKTFCSPDDVSSLSVLLPIQLKNADTTVPPAKLYQYLYLSLEHKELDNQNRDIFLSFFFVYVMMTGLKI